MCGVYNEPNTLYITFSMHHRQCMCKPSISHYIRGAIVFLNREKNASLVAARTCLVSPIVCVLSLWWERCWWCSTQKLPSSSHSIQQEDTERKALPALLPRFLPAHNIFNCEPTLGIKFKFNRPINSVV